jgi:hypothetical protein
MKGSVGANPPARGSTPVPCPKTSDYRYNTNNQLNQSNQSRISRNHSFRNDGSICFIQVGPLLRPTFRNPCAIVSGMAEVRN